MSHCSSFYLASDVRLAQISRASDELNRCVRERQSGDVGVTLGELDWLSELHRLLYEDSMDTDSKKRKQHPVATGVLGYFPDAIYEIAHVSFVGNEQHNPGSPMFWDRTKSTDEADALIRHFLERGTIDATDGLRHTAKMAWRALALLQKELEAENK